MREETFHCLALSLVPGLGPTGVHELIRRFGGAAEVLRLSRRELKGLGLSSDIQIFLASGCARKEAEKVARQAERLGVRIFSASDAEYSQLLKEIYDPPVVLYCRGTIEATRRPGLALVGSRRCTIYGKQVTQKLAREVAALGFNVVSGLARGIDSSAHLGALEAGGSTTAVLGCGVDIIYPRENRRLYERILDCGAVLSEFPLGSFPAPQNFPIRNRIISGLCYGTVISEASEHSGSLITARLTLEQNRELWAVPGNVTSPGSYGPNYLIKQGAGVVISTQDILEELPVYVLEFLSLTDLPSGPDAQAVGAGGKPVREVTPAEEQVLKLLAPDASRHFDWLLTHSPLKFSELTQTLLGLEMKGLIQQQPGRLYSRRLL